MTGAIIITPHARMRFVQRILRHNTPDIFAPWVTNLLRRFLASCAEDGRWLENPKMAEFLRARYAHKPGMRFLSSPTLGVTFAVVTGHDGRTPVVTTTFTYRHDILTAEPAVITQGENQ